ncbi:MAG: AIR synthase-related protein [Promethearchaeota archaeon]
MKVGKLSRDVMVELLEKYTNARYDPRVLNFPSIGDDAAVVDMGEYCIVTKMDQITLIGDISNLVYYVVNINANDVVTKGAIPRWFQSTLLFPEGIDSIQIEKIFFDIKKACEELGITIIGGHTEVTSGVHAPIAIGNMMGEVLKENLINGEDIEEGDDILLVKGIAIEGTALIAQEKAELLKEKGFDADFIKRCQGFLRNPGINASQPIIATFNTGRISAMHDPTEGGFGNALNELSEKVGHGFKILQDRILIYPETKRICDALGLDPMYLLASGCMIVICKPEQTVQIVRVIRNQKLDATVIGSVLDKGEKIYLMKGGEKEPLGGYRDDEIIKALAM